MSLEERSSVSDLRATAHPLRLQMLSLLTGAELSAAEVARELDITQANASYHLRQLHDAGLLVVAREESVRGGRAKVYRHPWDAELVRAAAAAEGTHHTDDDRLAYARALAEMIPHRFARRARGTRSLLTDAEMWVEPEVWERVLRLVREASTLLHAAAKPPRTDGTVRTALSVAAFRMQATSQAKAPDSADPGAADPSTSTSTSTSTTAAPSTTPGESR